MGLLTCKVDVFRYAMFVLVTHKNYEVIHPGELTQYVAHAAGGGGNTATQVWAWLQLLPIGDQPEHANDPSISWFELVISQLGHVYPTLDAHTGFQRRSTCQLCTIYIRKCGIATKELIEKIGPSNGKSHRKDPYSMMPQVSLSSHCSSMYFSGIVRKVAGLAIRPMMPYQQETMNVIRDHVEEHRKLKCKSLLQKLAFTSLTIFEGLIRKSL